MPTHTVFLGDVVPNGMAFTDGGRILLVAAGSALLVLDVAAAERWRPARSPGRCRHRGRVPSRWHRRRDGQFAFVTMEDSDQVDVFRLSGARQPRYVGAAPVGAVPRRLGVQPRRARPPM